MGKTKLLISGLSNTGKTTLLKSLENALVFSRDGKKFELPIPHVNVPNFTYASEFTTLMGEKICDYEDKIGKLPEIIVIDTISKVLLDIEGETLTRVKSFPYGVINTEVKALMDYIENILAPNFTIVLLSHAIHDAELDKYALVTCGGSWSKKGSVISEVSEAIFVECSGKKRTVHTNNPNMLSRTVLTDTPAKIPVSDFVLQDYINNILAKQTVVNTFSL